MQFILDFIIQNALPEPPDRVPRDPHLEHFGPSYNPNPTAGDDQTSNKKRSQVKTEKKHSKKVVMHLDDRRKSSGEGLGEE